MRATERLSCTSGWGCGVARGRGHRRSECPQGSTCWTGGVWCGSVPCKVWRTGQTLCWRTGALTPCSPALQRAGGSWAAARPGRSAVAHRSPLLAQPARPGQSASALLRFGGAVRGQASPHSFLCLLPALLCPAARTPCPARLHGGTVALPAAPRGLLSAART